MNPLFSERNNMRGTRVLTDCITKEMYALLIGVCNRYLPNMAGMFPEYCDDNAEQVCGGDRNSFKNYLLFRIPGLLFDYLGSVVAPTGDDFNQFALLDYIEFVGQTIKDYQRQDYHSFFQHQHIKILDSNTVFEDYRKEINEAFSLTGLLFVLDKTKQVERITDADAQIASTLAPIEKLEEPGLKQLIMDAIHLYKNPRPEIYHTAVEKIWDALERIKTVWVASGLDKKASMTELINKMSNGKKEYIDLFDSEFRALTDIGNHFRIRHHEMDKIDISDEQYYGYFFNRCFSLVSLALRYI